LYFGTALPASADRAVVKRLLHHKSYKVRLQAAIYLAKLREPKTLKAMMTCLSRDSHYLVRAFCAAGLGRLGSRKAIGVLKKASKDENAFVRKRAKQAIERIDIQSPAGHKRGYTLKYKPRAKILILVKAARRRRRRIPRRMRRFLLKTLRLQLNGERTFEVARGDVKVPRSWIRRRRLPAVRVEVRIVKVRRRRRGRRIKVAVQVKAIVTRYPSKAVALIAMTDAESSQQLKARASRRQVRTQFRYLERQAVEGAVQRITRRMRQINPS
jgi:hypothetical protein